MNRTATLNDYRWLVEGPGQDWLRQAAQWSLPLHALAGRLRQQLTALQCHLVLEQLELRSRARHRFPQADRMFFTRQGLQQATDAALAAYKAQQFPASPLRLDLCCGIGGDLVALADRGATVGYEQAPIEAYLAEANGQRREGSEVHVRRADVTQISLPPQATVHIDPDRRPGNRRSVRLEHHEPGRDFLQRMQKKHEAMAWKLAPATDPCDPLLEAAQLEWIGHRRECQQLVAWFGTAAAHPGCRVATVLDTADGCQSLVGAGHSPLPMADDIGPFLVEPHAAVLAAGLAADLAALWDFQSVTIGGGYLTGPACIFHPLAATFEVLGVASLRPQKLRPLLRHHQIGPLEVKVRGLAINPAKFRKSLPLTGDQPAVLLLARRPDSSVAILSRRVTEPRG